MVRTTVRNYDFLGIDRHIGIVKVAFTIRIAEEDE